MCRMRGIATATLLAVVACGGKLAPLPGEQGKDGGVIGPGVDASVDGGGDAGEDGASSDAGDAGPPPVPVCSGAFPMCLPPDAGVVWHGSSVISCQPQDYPGPWTMILERQVGPSFQQIQTLTVYPGESPITFYDTSAAPSQHTYRVCSLENGKTTPLCGYPFSADGSPNCGCEPTSCYLQTACNTTIDDQCGGMLSCGACANGMPCNPENNSCCPQGFMSNLWGGCVCAPPTPKACPIWYWDTVTCACMPGM